MFLSKFPINSARRGSRHLLGSPHAMHGAVLAAFPPSSPLPESNGRVLWRVDRTGPSTFLFVLSPQRPDFTHLVEQAGWPTSDQEPWQVHPYDGLLSGIQDGQPWAFRLRANPVKALRDQRKRVAHVTAAQQVQWLIVRAERAGFSVREQQRIPDVVVSEREQRTFRRGTGEVTLATARFDGTLTVTDAQMFKAALVNGIGKAKGYGCGLMTIVRPEGLR